MGMQLPLDIRDHCRYDSMILMSVLNEICPMLKEILITERHGYRLLLPFSRPYCSASRLPSTASYGGLYEDVTRKRVLCIRLVLFPKHQTKST